MVASILREQAEVIKKQKEIDEEIKILQNQEVVASILSDKYKPFEAIEKVRKNRVETSKSIRESLKKAQEAKEEEDRQIEAIRADRIRQLKAENTVHRRHIKVFDPTTVVGPVFLDQMSYMEMQERLSSKVDGSQMNNVYVVSSDPNAI